MEMIQCEPIHSLARSKGIYNKRPPTLQLLFYVPVETTTVIYIIVCKYWFVCFEY